MRVSRFAYLAVVAAVAMSPAASRAASLTTLFSFDSGPDGGQPYAGVTIDAAGNLFGTTTFGGPSGPFGGGTAFKLSPNGTLTTLVDFSFGDDGRKPYAGLVADPTGNLYGTTLYGGTAGAGTIFKLTPSGTLTTLVSFDNAYISSSGGFPYTGGLTIDTAGNLFGATTTGGESGGGTVFKLSPDGTFTTLANFSGAAASSTGRTSYSGVTLDAAGNLFGTTVGGGANNFGTVFKISPDGMLTTLVSFDFENGYEADGRLVVDSEGNLFGTTEVTGPGGNGTLFKLTPDGVLTTLVSFDGANGSRPVAGLIMDAAGDLFGTTSSGGANGLGTVFKLDPNSVLTTLIDFDGSNGSSPRATLTADAAGNLFGTTYGGGTSSGYGTVFKITDAGFVPFAAAVPEPAGWAMLIGGFGMIGGSMRRRPQRRPATA